MNLLMEHLNGVMSAAEQRMPRLVHRDRRVSSPEFRDAAGAVVTGAARDFWDLSLPVAQQHDSEQEVPIFAAVWAATRMPGATPAERWARVERAIRDEAIRYAEIKTGEERA